MPTKEEYRPRLATITRNYLKVIIARGGSARKELEEILAWIDQQQIEAKLNMDRSRQAKLGELSLHAAKLIADLAEIESSANAATKGRVAEKEEPK